MKYIENIYIYTMVGVSVGFIGGGVLGLISAIGDVWGDIRNDSEKLHTLEKKIESQLSDDDEGYDTVH